MGIVVYNGVSSEDLDIVVEHPPKYHFPQRDYDVIHVPGRNGDVVFDKGSYQNVIRQYELAIGDYTHDYTYLVNRISEWLHSGSGYARLEDSYEPEYFRQAMFMNEGEIENLYAHAGRITVEFNCKPQRFLKSGEVIHEITASDTVLVNPTNFESRPKLIVYGTGPGDLWFTKTDSKTGEQKEHSTLSINEINSSIIIDSELMDAYSIVDDEGTTVNRNNDIMGKFPYIFTGINTINFNGGITKVEVIPRWWTL